MTNRDEPNSYHAILKWLETLGALPWPKIIEALRRTGSRIFSRSPASGLYEVLEYESTVMLHDRDGKRATVKKRERVRYLQDNIIAYQDQVWGDGEIMKGYRCSPGVPVDEYRSGHKTLVLISLREEKRKGDIDEFNITWGMKNGFLIEDGYWATAISHKTKQVRVNVIFPKDRPPLHTAAVDSARKRKNSAGKLSLSQRPDGRWLVAWQMKAPRQFDNYLLKWKW